MFFTEEQLERLEKYRKTFETAVHSDFARNVGSIALKEIESIYDEALGSHYSYNSGCSVCVLGFIKKVGAVFLKESEIIAKKAKKENEEQAQELAMNENKPESLQKPKRTRKKKEIKEDGTES